MSKQERSSCIRHSSWIEIGVAEIRKGVQTRARTSLKDIMLSLKYKIFVLAIQFNFYQKMLIFLIN